MTLLFVDGFDDINDSDIVSSLQTKWTTASEVGSYPFSAPTGRFDTGKCLQLQIDNDYIYKTIPVSTEIYLGFAFKYINGSTDEFLSFGSDYPHYQLAFSNGMFAVNGYIHPPDSGYLDYIMQPETWYYVEIYHKCGTGDGEIELKVNDVTWYSASNINSTYNNATITRYIRFEGKQQIGTGGFYIDDLYLCNGDGTKNNSFLGNCRVFSLNPNGAGNYSQFTPSAGTNYECVDDGEWGGSDDNVQSITNAQIDTHTFEDMPSSGYGAIKGIQLVNGSKRLVQSATNSKMKHVIRSNSTDYTSTDVELTDNISAALKIYEEDPDDSQDWTKTKIDATEFGYQSVIS
jgi:hypothetical protein